MTANTGPSEDRATIPKLSVPSLLVLTPLVIPLPRLSMKGTVMGPVVTPPESKATGAISGLVKKAVSYTHLTLPTIA